MEVWSISARPDLHSLTQAIATFRRLVPHAETHRLRLICPNLRDYLGSSLYTTKDMDAFQNRDRDVQAAAIRRFGQELATFLQHIIEVHSLPPISSQDASRVGGIAVLGWGYGNALLLSLMGNVHTLPQEMQTLLTRYARTVVVYGESIFPDAYSWLTNKPS